MASHVDSVKTAAITTAYWATMEVLETVVEQKGARYGQTRIALSACYDVFPGIVCYDYLPEDIRQKVQI